MHNTLRWKICQTFSTDHQTNRPTKGTHRSSIPELKNEGGMTLKNRPKGKVNLYITGKTKNVSKRFCIHTVVLGVLKQ